MPDRILRDNDDTLDLPSIAGPVGDVVSHRQAGSPHSRCVPVCPPRRCRADGMHSFALPPWSPLPPKPPPRAAKRRVARARTGCDWSLGHCDRSCRPALSSRLTIFSPHGNGPAALCGLVTTTSRNVSACAVVPPRWAPSRRRQAASVPQRGSARTEPSGRRPLADRVPYCHPDRHLSGRRASGRANRPPPPDSDPTTAAVPRPRRTLAPGLPERARGPVTSEGHLRDGAGPERPAPNRASLPLPASGLRGQLTGTTAGELVRRPRSHGRGARLPPALHHRTAATSPALPTALPAAPRHRQSGATEGSSCYEHPLVDPQLAQT